MTDREKKLNTDREWLADELMRAGSLALPSSLSAAALFERMDAADQQAAAPKKKGGAIWLQWRRWGSIAAVLVLAAGTAFLLQNSSLQNKASQDESSYDAALAPNEAENRDMWNGSADEAPGPGGLMMASPPNPSTAGGDGSVKKEYAADEIDSDRGLFEEFKSKIVSVGEQPIPDMMDYDAMAAIASQLFGGDYDQARRSSVYRMRPDATLPAPRKSHTAAAIATRKPFCAMLQSWIRRCTASSRRSAGWWITAERAPRC